MYTIHESINDFIRIHFIICHKYLRFAILISPIPTFQDVFDENNFQLEFRIIEGCLCFQPNLVNTCYSQEATSNRNVSSYMLNNANFLKQQFKDSIHSKI